MSEVVIKIENLKKKYRLGTIGGTTLSAELQSWWAGIRGKEDPNMKIGLDKSKYGDEFYALEGIDLEIHKGEAVGIIGHNGAGKSTLLKILSQVTAPTEGLIKIKGRVSSMLEVGTGFHKELTGRENIYMNGAVLGMTKKEVDSKIEDIIDFSECRDFIDTPVKRYSSGMYVKLAFAVAAYLDAEIMVMDEVLAVGDVKFQKKCLGKMDDAAHTEGKTVLYVSHNMTTIRQLCTRCIVLNHGKVVFDGDVEKAIQVYMEQGAVEMKSFYDLKDSKRPSLDHGRTLHVNSLEFINKTAPSYRNDEKVVFEVNFTSNIDIDDLRIYYTVLDEEGKIVGTVQSDVICSPRKGETRTCTMEMDVSNFVEGTYSFLLDMYSSSGMGAHLSYDHPLDYIYFEIAESAEQDTIFWQKRYFGSIRLNGLKCIGCT
ncbi:ABC transporter ATP-binding protein [Butyrivibrio sp. AE2015]|uniref:ABC transporter ATP-binding protein n=1 Tax=Butyrivibrio sp. AE2015 TaxID=1280663 RepID=UPI0003B68D52|nr:polysaccharide ABC transporter ATP-binding protein [Butyrivibrio sp. AE2015]